MFFVPKEILVRQCKTEKMIYMFGTLVSHGRGAFLALSCARTICSEQDGGPRTLCKVRNGAPQRNDEGRERGAEMGRGYK